MYSNSTTVRACLHCGREFSVRYPSSRVRYCSLSCGAYAPRRPRRPRKCRPVADRFWEKVTKTENCWLWTGNRNRDGYGELGVAKTPSLPGGLMRAHRLSWEIHYGPIPDKMDVLHTCDVPPCVRPDHLFLGSHTDNMKDMARKGRSNLGERCPLAKLRAVDIPTIRERYAQGDVTLSVLASEYGVTSGAVGQAVRRKSWRHIP